MDGVDQEQVSITVGDYKFPDSDSDPNSSSSSHPRLEFLTRDRMVKLVEGNPEHELIKKDFLGGMGTITTDISVVAIHRNSHSSVEGLARFEAFRVFSEAMRTKCAGNANIKRAWYGAAKDEICGIINNGFYGCREAENDNGLHLHGRGVYLSPANCSIDGALWSDEDENGMRHILLCIVILGNMEVVCDGSRQIKPSSMKFDSGVDNISAPKRYIIWCAYMNSHILPKYIISIIPSSRALQRYRRDSRSNIPTRVSRTLSLLPLEKVLIDKYKSEFQQNRITRDQLVKRIGELARVMRFGSWIKFCTKGEI